MEHYLPSETLFSPAPLLGLALTNRHDNKKAPAEAGAFFYAL